MLAIRARLASILLKRRRRLRLWFEYHRALAEYRRLNAEGGTTVAPPIFVVGCSHSGTSVVLAILGAHSSIYAYPSESMMAFRRRWAARRLLRRFEVLAVVNGKRRWAEKTPTHIRKIGEIFGLCPEARVLLIIRDGRDVACSIRDRHGSLEEGARRWLSDNLAGREFWSHPNVYRFRYEDLVSDCRGTLKGILGFLGEEYEEQMERHHEKPMMMFSDTVTKPPDASQVHHDQYRNWQMNQPLFNGSGRWKALEEADLLMVERIQKDLLAELGYLGPESGRGPGVDGK